MKAELGEKEKREARMIAVIREMKGVIKNN